MVSVASSLVRVSSSREDASRAVEEAIQGFKRALACNGLEKELQDLERNNKIPPADAVLTFTAQLDSANASRRGRSIATRLHPVLESVHQYTTIVDTFVSSDPKIAGLIWGSIKTTLKFVSNYVSYFESFTALFIKLKTYCPVFGEYQALYSTSKGLKKALSNFHASIIHCCTHMVEVVQRSVIQQLWQALRSFDEEFDSYKAEIQRHGDNVKVQIELAKAKADLQHQQIQAEEQKLVQKKLGKLVFSSRSQHDRLSEMRLQQAKMESENKIQRLLNGLSSFDHFAPFREACKRRCPNTTQWVFSTDPFIRWETSSNVIWVNGKIGSGKTITAASSIQHILANKNDKEFVTYHFFQYSDPQSLKVETMIRSVIRQALKLVTLSQDMIDMLKNMEGEKFSVQENLLAFLRHIITLSDRFYIFLDGVDECNSAHQHMIFDILLSFMGIDKSPVRIFISGRDTLVDELLRRFPDLEWISMGSDGAKLDLGLYVESMMLERKEKGNLGTEDQTLLEEIKFSLTKHADGMFLWVAFLMDDLCAQYCDDDIRKCLKNLPKDLRDTFNRVLSRIVARKRDGVVAKIIPWLAAAARPLTLDELCEAVSIEIGQKNSAPGKRVNDKRRILDWCENLVHIDEEDESVQFAHHTIFQFLTEGWSDMKFADFHVSLEEADYLLGEKCLTYLHYGDFQGALTQRPETCLLEPASIGLAAVPKHGMRKSFSDLVMNRMFVEQKNGRKYDLNTLRSYQIRADTARASQQREFPFLKYALENWLHHTALLEETSLTWPLLQGIIMDNRNLIEKPWGEDDSSQIELQIGTWAFGHHHYALLSMMLKKLITMVLEGNRLIVSGMVKHIAFPALEENEKMRSFVRLIFLKAAPKDREFAEIATMLRVVGSKLDDLEAAISENDQMEVVAPRNGYMEDGYMEAAEINPPDTDAIINTVGNNGFTALRTACGIGDIEIVEHLIAENADPNIDTPWHEGFTSLQAASAGGHFEIVKQLIAAGAYIHSLPAPHGGRTALQAAAGGGHLDIVEYLVNHHANIDARPARIKGYTALQAASKGGYLEVVKYLVGANANVNAAPAWNKGRTALQAASENGHIEVVDYLIAANADVNAAPASLGGCTALQAAAGGGHQDIIKRLIAAKA